ncbi:stage III sporulation protein AF [Aeribacillus alveayuensis]|uniref:Stage III sporulation protein AF n=1 Tax=Aeribacillus alveayuensis TaxID=279215 RepID=A0ABT9VKK6_9BACI|nr:stage III sporulation protein AF [Bacillus alveayuensis]
MSFLTDWITNIILFILLALIVDMLLPNSSMQKYAKLVISLLLVVVIITPIFKIFSIDTHELFAEMNNPLFVHDEQIKNEMELKKNDIQAKERAYILEQMAVQMKLFAEEELMERYGIKIENILLSTNPNQQQIYSEKDIDEVIVTLAESNSDTAIETIQPIEIKPFATERDENQHMALESEIIEQLALTWGIPTHKITVRMEGGEDR